VTVQSLEAVENVLRRGGFQVRGARDWLIAPFPSELGMGAWLFGQDRASSLFGQTN
jgi:hypothetical protein